MSLIDHLEHTISPAVLGDASSIAHISVLEQFYALMIARLAIPQAYSQFLGNQQRLDQANVAVPLFEQIWHTDTQRTLMVEELALMHHLDAETIVQLLTNAAPLTYQALIDAAKGQFLPAYLQGVAPSVRPLLPVWAESVLVDTPASPVTDPHVPEPPAIDKAATPVMIEEDEVNTDAVTDQTLAPAPISAKPSDYRTPEVSGQAQSTPLPTRARNRRRDLIVRLVLLIAALTALFLLWLLVIKPNQTAPAEPVVTAPQPIAAAPVVPPTLDPVELIVAIDDSGNLYTCSATVGDISAQAMLKQALTLSFGSQADICELSVVEGVATELPMSAQSLSDAVMRLRSAPFARLHLQNGSITLEAPDAAQLQRLLSDMRALAPTVSVMAAAPLPLPQPEVTMDDNMDATMDGNQVDAPIPDDSAAQNFSSDASDSQSTVATDAVPPPRPSDMTNQTRDQNEPASSNNISNAEVDDLANSIIVAEELRGARPVDKNITPTP